MVKAQDSEYYTIAEAAKLLGISPSTIWRWIDAQKLPAYQVGPRKSRIKKEDLEAVIRSAQGLPTTYDSLYVVLAALLQAESWTDDRRLLTNLGPNAPWVRWIGDCPGT